MSDPKDTSLAHFSEEMIKLKKRVHELEEVLNSCEKSASSPISPENSDENEGLFDNTPDLVLILDSQGKFIYVNKIGRDALAYDSLDLTNISFLDILRHDQIEKWKELFQKMVQQETTVQASLIFRSKNGSEIAVEGDLKPVLKKGELVRVNAVLRNITEARQMAWDREWYFNSSLDLLFIAGFDGFIQRVNPAFERTLGHYQYEVTGKPLLDFIAEEDHLISRKELQKLKSGTPSIYFEVRFKAKDGSSRWLAWTAHSVQSEETIYGVARDITAKKKLEEELRKLSFSDELTGLYNRHGFMTFAGKLKDLAYREGRVLIAILIQLNNLKEINDQFGHHSGDEALMRVSKLLKKVFRGSDILARFGEAEYVVCALVSDQKVCEKIKTRLSKLCDKENNEAGKPYRLSFNFGFSFRDPRSNNSLEEMLCAADEALLEDKHAWEKQRAIAAS